MDNVFDFRNRLINEYSSFSRSFSKVSAKDILSKWNRNTPVAATGLSR
jgi:hypothetical protein